MSQKQWKKCDLNTANDLTNPDFTQDPIGNSSSGEKKKRLFSF